MSEDHHHPGHGEHVHHGDHPREKPAAHHDEAHNGHQDHHAHMVADFRQRFWISLALTLPVLVLSPMIQELLRLGERLKFAGDVYVLFVLSTAIFVYGGFPFLKGMIAELKTLRPGMMTLISLAVSVAYIYSCAVVFGLPGKMFFWELASLIDIMLLGHWIEMKSVMGASRALEALVRLMPSEAHRLGPDGQIEDVSNSRLNVGDRILIKPSEKAPADGRVVEGASSVNEAMLTGESRPVEKSAGDGIIGGSINGEGSLVVEIEKTGADSFLSQVIDLVRTAQESKSRTQSLANRAAFWLTLIAIGAGGLTFFIWLLVMDKDLAFALERTVSVMVITCPHALGLAVPLVVAVSTALSASNGLLIRNRTAFENARRLQAVVFDKTGTLTRGEFGISDVLLLDNSIDREKLLNLAASVESHSEHPIARGIVAGAQEASPVKDFRAIPGKGAQGSVEGRVVKVVSPGYLAEQGIEVKHPGGESPFGEGETVVYVLIEDQPAGAIALGDVIREESREAIRELKSFNIQCMMLTGDNRHVARRVSAELDLDDYFAEVLPEQKALKIKEVQGRGLVTAMVGDGVNDAPALAQADIGIAIGAGTDVAVETADIVLVRSSPRDVLKLIRLGRATYAKMVQNLIWATGYNVIAIPLAAGVLYSYGIMVSPAIAAVLMSLSTVIVAINARLLKLT